MLKHEISIFKDLLRIDVQTRTPGVAFDDAWARREGRDIDGVCYWILSQDDLIATGWFEGGAASRPRDLDDLRVLDQDGSG